MIFILFLCSALFSCCCCCINSILYAIIITYIPYIFNISSEQHMNTFNDNECVQTTTTRNMLKSNQYWLSKYLTICLLISFHSRLDVKWDEMWDNHQQKTRKVWLDVNVRKKRWGECFVIKRQTNVPIYMEKRGEKSFYATLITYKIKLIE